MGFKIKDHYFKKAKENNFAARSAFKLEEIDQKFKILKKKMHVLDLGYHPGSWLQYASPIVGDKGHIYGIDLKPVNQKICQSIKNVTLRQMDFFHLKPLWEHPLDVILSDMAADTTGIKSVDQENSFRLVKNVFELIPSHLKEGGHMVAKVFDSPDAQTFLKQQKPHFKQFSRFKPRSTRPSSKEFFVIGKGFRPPRQYQKPTSPNEVATSKSTPTSLK